ncbi:GspH/FimT family pseudopilin [Polaromonas sp.]|uniref:GspH/FimT family pseudopilin n=1 Tax=Polaromonas sp. TaxID=1869339 RepID=UPI0025E20C92|nr:GspH/FimT family pseudopilin [Polaromonas sp.]
MKFRGMTLIELMVAIALVAIIMAIGVPSYRYITYSSRIAGEINSLLGDLQFARSEAAKEGVPVTVCASTDGTSCSGSAAWSSGWIVFVDNSTAGTAVPGNAVVDSGDTVLRKYPSIAAFDSFLASNSAAAFTFNRDGFLINQTADPVTLTLKPVNGTDTKWTRCLAVAMIGRMTVQRSGTGACA